jgi:glycosyltransferase involved in cell wall biosynthesis
MRDQSRLRVALLAGSLGQGGAEKQFLYLARELVRAGVDVRVFTLTQGEFYEPMLERAGAPVDWRGRYRLPLRLIDVSFTVRRFRPHVVQAVHFFMNLYAVAAARLCGGIEIGSIRNDTQFDMAECGRWGKPLLHVPRTLIANSSAAAENAQKVGADATRIQVLTNVIDLDAFDSVRNAPQVDPRSHDDATAILIARLVPAKRVDRFLNALARARQSGVPVRGVIVGDGPERSRLETLARARALGAGGVQFIGERSDVPALLATADMLVLSSDHEGFPNVILEAMAARLPVIATPAGDVTTLVEDGRTGFIVPFDDEDLLVSRLTELARNRARRRAFGAAGRKLVEERYRIDSLARRALQIYQYAGRQQRSPKAIAAVDAVTV